MFRNPWNFAPPYGNPVRMIANINVGTNKKIISLNSKGYLDFIPYLPLDFTIRTNNSSARFNSCLLKNASEIIMNFLATNPPNLDYLIQIDDDHNVIGKFEKLFRGQTVKFDQNDYTTYDEIKTRLNMVTLPNITGNNNFNNNNNFMRFNAYRPRITFSLMPGNGIVINNTYLLHEIDFPYFTIKTKRNSYNCNLFGVVSSTVIRQFFVENPNADSYTYDYDDDSNDFQYIENLFNFSAVSLSNLNVDCIKEIAEDLGIEYILKTIDDFIDENKEISKLIEDQQTVVDSVKEIFVALFNIKNDTIEKVSKLISESKWSRTEKDIYELSAFILHVSFQDIKLHENIIDLLIKLDEEKDESKNKLGLLKPFISNNLITIFNKYLLISSNDNDNYRAQMAYYNDPFADLIPNKYNSNEHKHLVYPLVYRMIKKGFMPKERIEPLLKKCPLVNLFFVSWFLPELIELNENKLAIGDIKKQVFISEKSKDRGFKSGVSKEKGFHPTVCIKGSISQFGKNKAQNRSFRKNKFDFLNKTINYVADSYCPIVPDIEKYKELRDTFENSNGIAKAIRDDDVGSFQSAISNNMDVLLNKQIDQNMFEPFISGSMRYINYAAAYGSIKCFKFMLLNHQKLDSETYEMAILGENSEIIRIIDNSKDSIKTNNPQQNNNIFGHRMNQYDNIDPLLKTIFKGLCVAIKMHKYEIFDWIIDNNNKIIEQLPFLISMEIHSAMSGNVHSLFTIINSGAGFSKNDDYNNKNRFSHGIENAAKRGFYSFIKILNETYNKDKGQDIHIDPISIVSFNSIYILEYLTEYVSQFDLLNAFYYSINTKQTAIINYFFNTILHNNKLHLNQSNSFLALSNCFTEDSNDEFFDFIIDKINSFYSFNVISLLDLLKIINEPPDSNPKMNRNPYMIVYEDLQKTKKVNNVNAYIKLAKLIFKKNPKSNFTDISIIASTHNLNELIIFLINNKYILNYINLAETIIVKGKIDLKIFPLIMDQIDTENRNRILNSIDKLVPKKEEKLIDYLIKENAAISSTLIQAVSDNNLNLVKKILKANNDPSFINKNSKNGTALAIAARNNYTDIASRLLSIPGIDPNIYCKDFWTPLVISVFETHKYIFDLLINFYKEDITKQKWQLEKSLSIIINRKDDEEIDFKNNNNNNNNRFTFNRNINISEDEIKKRKEEKKLVIKSLGKFSKQKQLEIFKSIIQLNCVDPNFNTTNNTLLTFACSIGDIDSVKTLIQNELTDVNLINSKTGNTALITSINDKKVEITKLLLQHPKIELNTKNFEGDTAFIFAIKTKQNEIAELIFNNEKFNADEDEINCAFCLSSFGLAKKIISNKLFNTNYINNHETIVSNEKSTLIKILTLNDPSLFDLFIQHPSFNKKDKSVIINLFHEALLNCKSSEILQKILTLLGEFQIDINSPIFDGNSPLVEISNIKYATYHGFEFIVSCPNFDSKKSELLRAFKLLYSKSSSFADIDKFYSMDILYNYDKEHDHSIVLDNSLLNKIYDIMFKQSRIDPNQNQRLIYGNMTTVGLPLLYAIKNNLYILTACLVNSGQINENYFIPINDSNELTQNQKQVSNNTTYIHYAASLGRIEILKLILSSRSSIINVENKNGETPLFEACRNKQIECIKFLFQFDTLDYRHKNRRGQDVIKIIEQFRPIYANDKTDLSTKEKYLDHLLKLLKNFKLLVQVPKAIVPKISITTNYMKSSIMGSSKSGKFTNYHKSRNKETKFVFGKKNSSSSELEEDDELKPSESLADRLTRATANLPSGENVQSFEFNQKVKSPSASSFGKNVSKSESDHNPTFSFVKKTNLEESDKPSHSGETFSFGNKSQANKSNQQSQKNGTFSFGIKSQEGKSSQPSHSGATFLFGKKLQSDESDQPSHSGATYSFSKKHQEGESSQPSHSGATFSFSKKSSSAKNPVQPNKQPDMTKKSAPAKLSRPKFTIHTESFTVKPSLNFHAKSHPALSNSKVSESSGDELSNDIIKISRTLLEMTERKARELALSLVDDERQQQSYMQQPPLPQPYFPNQSQFMFMQQQQQQQQQLYRMIQMTNELQAQNYWQMMNQAQVNQRSQSQTKKKKKRSKK